MTWPIPSFIDRQYSIPSGIDADNCVEQALCHAIWMMTGRRYSPRALGWMVDVSPSGSEVAKAVEVINSQGLIPYDLWPNPDSFTWASYYQDIPQYILAQAEFIHVEFIPPDLNKSPLLIELVFNPNASSPGPYHLATQFSPTQYFDSEKWNNDPGPVRNLNFLGATIKWSSSIKLTFKNMSNAVWVHKPGTQEYGFFLPATTAEAAKDKALNLGREDILKADGTVDFTKAQEGI